MIISNQLNDFSSKTKIRVNIGRWLTTDPAGQYASPYLGMGNDPINGIDPDGGYKTRLGRFVAWVGGGFKGSFVNNEGSRFANQRFGILTTGNLDGGIVGTLSFGGDFYKDRMPTISAPSNFKSFFYDIDRFQNSTSKNAKEALGKIALNLTYGTAENVYSLFSGKKFTGENLQGDHRVNAGVDGLTTLATTGLGSSVNRGLKILKSSPGLYSSFAKQTRGLFKGANHNQLRAKAYKEMIRKHNFNVEHGRGAVNLMNVSTNAIEISSEISNQND